MGMIMGGAMQDQVKCIYILRILVQQLLYLQLDEAVMQLLLPIMLSGNSLHINLLCSKLSSHTFNESNDSNCENMARVQIVNAVMKPNNDSKL